MTFFPFHIGRPMIFASLSVMITALLPVIFLEAYSLYSVLEITFWQAMAIEIAANLISTFIAIPIAWVLLVSAQLITGGGRVYGTDTFSRQFLAVTWQAPWLMPYENHLRWMVPVARMVLLIPFFFASWLCEYFIIRYFFTETNGVNLGGIVGNANLLSYGLLGLYLLGRYWSLKLRGE